MLPFREDKNIKVTSGYGKRSFTLNGKPYSDFHTGIDLVPVPYKSGDEIFAFEDGVVTKVQKTGKQWGTACFVRIKHANGLYTLYYHLKSNTICVNAGDKVKKGQAIGVIGTTGNSSGVHLHFQIDKGSNATSIDPYDYVFNGKSLIDPEPAPESKPEPITELNVGDRVIVSGVLYMDSYASTKGKKVTNYETTIALKTDLKRPAPYNIYGKSKQYLGWVRKEDIKKI